MIYARPGVEESVTQGIFLTTVPCYFGRWRRIPVPMRWRRRSERALWS